MKNKPLLNAEFAYSQYSMQCDVRGPGKAHKSFACAVRFSRDSQRRLDSKDHGHGTRMVN